MKDSDRDEFAELNRACPLVPPATPAAAAALLGAARAVYRKDRVDRSVAEQLYHDAATRLVFAARASFVKSLASHPRSDAEVVSSLMAYDGLDPAEVDRLTGLGPGHAEAAAAGAVTLDRRGVAAYAEALRVDASAFDHTAFLGAGSRPAGRFRVMDHAGFFTLHDAETGRAAHLGDGAGRVAVSGPAGDGFLDPESFGFAQAWERRLNADPGETLRLYFSFADALPAAARGR